MFFVCNSTLKTWKCAALRSLGVASIWGRGFAEWNSLRKGLAVTLYFLWGRRLPPRLNWILPSSGLVCRVRWFETDVSGLVSIEAWNVGSNHLTPRTNPEDGRTLFFCTRRNTKRGTSGALPLLLAVVTPCAGVITACHKCVFRALLPCRSNTRLITRFRNSVWFRLISVFKRLINSTIWEQTALTG